MFGGLQANALGQIGVVESLIAQHENYIGTQPSELRGAIKVYAVASCVTRLYAIYERFVESLLSDFLDSVPELIPYAYLSEGLKKEYRVGISHILGKLENERYSHLTHENIILWYHEAISNESKYRFVTEALTRHDHNLRLNVVEHLASRIGLENIRAWLTKSEEITSLYEEQTAIAEQLDAEIRSFIQLRNDAAHGTLEALEGRDNLKRYCELIAALVKALGDYISASLLKERAQAGRSRKVGVVTEVFEKAGAYVVQLDAGTVLNRGLQVHLLGSNYYLSETIVSIQVMGEDVEQLTAERDAVEVGLRCNVNPRRNSELYVDVVNPSLEPTL
jgi:hypothetical protein